MGRESMVVEEEVSQALVKMEQTYDGRKSQSTPKEKWSEDRVCVLYGNDVSSNCAGLLMYIWEVDGSKHMNHVNKEYTKELGLGSYQADDTM